jgi:hypothetical protein
MKKGCLKLNSLDTYSLLLTPQLMKLNKDEGKHQYNTTGFYLFLKRVFTYFLKLFQDKKNKHC